MRFSVRWNAPVNGERGSVQDQVLLQDEVPAAPSDLKSREGGKKCGFRK